MKTNNQPDKLRGKLIKILNKFFPDEMDNQMYHPNLPTVVDEIMSLISQDREEIMGEIESGLNRDTSNDLYTILWKIAFDTDKSHFQKYVDDIKALLRSKLGGTSGK